jgi:hypothetical protein
MKIWADSELKKAEQEQQKARRERVIVALPSIFLSMTSFP